MSESITIAITKSSKQGQPNGRRSWEMPKNILSGGRVCPEMKPVSFVTVERYREDG